MELGKVQFGLLEGLIKSGKTFEDLDVNKDGKIDSQDQEYLSSIQNALAGILNEQDEDSEIVNEDLNNLEFGGNNTNPNVAQTPSTPTRTTSGNTSTPSNSTSNTVSDLQNRMVTLSMQSGRLQEEQEDLKEELEDKKAEQEKIEKEILAKQQEYALLTNEIQNSQDNDSSKIDRAERLAGEMTILQGALENLVSDIAEIEKQYQSNATQLQTLNTQIQTLQSQTMQLIEQEKRSAEVTNDNAQVGNAEKAGFKEETTPVNQTQNVNNVNSSNNKSTSIFNNLENGDTVPLESILPTLSDSERKFIEEETAKGNPVYLVKHGKHWEVYDKDGKSLKKYFKDPKSGAYYVPLPDQPTVHKHISVNKPGEKPFVKITSVNDDFTNGTATLVAREHKIKTESEVWEDLTKRIKDPSDPYFAELRGYGVKVNAELLNQCCYKGGHLYYKDSGIDVLAEAKAASSPSFRIVRADYVEYCPHVASNPACSLPLINAHRTEQTRDDEGRLNMTVYYFSNVSDDLSEADIRTILYEEGEYIYSLLGPDPLSVFL